ncbi:MAG: NADPH-dependent glutamate synthase [Actinomycetota bacterium]|nr:NADPH-dependent glutamate synthase [Actinomycetota bacterium]
MENNNNKENEKLKKKFKTKMPEQQPDKRMRNFNEVALGYNEEEAILEASRCLQCKKPKCIEGCPVEIDIKSFIGLIAKKDFKGALSKIREKNSLPAICGRVCPQEDQCEKMCILGIKNEPVAIGRLERFAADFEDSKDCAESDSVSSVKKERISENKSKVAVVGSGPAGLTCASELAKRGYKVTIFEALHKAGGVLVYGIPEFRLPKKILQKEIDYVKNLGIEIKLNSLVGNTYELDDLFGEGYKAIFIATGAGLPYFMGIPGENLNGVYSANEFLTRNNLMKSYLFPAYDTPIKRVKKIAVVGGGNVAMDSARTAKRLGAEHVYLIYRRSEKEMPARIEEVHHAKEEGIEFLLLSNPVAIIGSCNLVEKIRCIKMELGQPDSSGRCSPVPIKDSEFDIDVEAVVMAIGQGPNPLLLNKIPELKLTKKGNIEADSNTCKTSVKGIFAGGDITTGAATVILAMGAGKKAAFSIDDYLSNDLW